MKVNAEILKGIETLKDVPVKFLTSEQKTLLSHAGELKTLATYIEDLGLSDVVEIHVKISKRGRKAKQQ